MKRRGDNGFGFMVLRNVLMGFRVVDGNELLRAVQWVVVVGGDKSSRCQTQSFQLEAELSLVPRRLLTNQNIAFSRFPEINFQLLLEFG